MPKNCLTLYHKIGNSYSKSVFFDVKIRRIDRIKPENSGVVKDCSTSVRIFTNKKLDVATKDKIVLGRCSLALPPKDALSVTAVFDNSGALGTAKHFRLCME